MSLPLDTLSRLSAGLPLCRRCLLEDLSLDFDLKGLLGRLADGIPPGGRADSALVAERLSVCRECDSLNAGTCALCGCFVELRAQKKRAVCPHVPGKWPANRPKEDLP